MGMMQARLAAMALALATTMGNVLAEDSPAPDVPLKTVSVEPFLAAEAVGGSVTSDGLTAMLIDALNKDGHFLVVERSLGLAGVQAEQGLGTASSTTAETSAKTGQLIGSSAIVRGTVIKYEANAKGGGLSAGGFGLGSFLAPQAGIKHSSASLSVSIRLIDTTTGQIIGTYEAQGEAGSNSAGIDAVNPKTGLSLGANAFSNTPIGQAAQDAIVKCVAKIVEGMRRVPWSSSIVDASDGRIFVSGGNDRHLKPGTLLTVVRKGKVFTDPTTGAVLDVDLQSIATVKLDAVKDKLSIASLIDGQTPARGDLVQLK